MAKVGDIVRFLNAVGGGKITRIKENIAYVEDSDGFDTPVLVKECVVFDVANAPTPAYDRPAPKAPSNNISPVNNPPELKL